MSELEHALRTTGAGSDASQAANQGFQERASGEGLVDIAFITYHSPLGAMLLAATPRGLLRVAYHDQEAEMVLQDLAERVSPRILEMPSRLDEVRRQLDEYFAGGRRRFDLPLDWDLVEGFHRGVLQATARVPFGEVTSYRQVAAEAGSPRGARAAGNALGANPIPVVVPCHRVVRSGGALGGYTGGIERKQFLLDLEGVTLPT
ncbi:MAG: methylated-DNA--[protein]-cysteine S-methyltransferase [Actinomycetota bacterium]|nr:methylated-DNA--[protein]-cysteine S-methyltransferase [Actinomycetota bacterium]